MEEAFLAENITPSYGSEYSPENALESMRLMKQVLENRLKDPKRYKASGAKDEFDILRMGGQFPEYSPQGRLQGRAAENVSDILTIANKSNDPRHNAYRQFVQMAIQVAHEQLDPSTLQWPNVTGWYSDRNKADEHVNHLGSGFEIVGSLAKNTFYKTKTIPDAGRIHRLAHAIGKTHGLHSKLHDLALRQGHPGLGSFAPPAPGQKPAVKQPHRHGHETQEHGLQAGANQTSAANSPSFRAQLAEAKAQVAQARAERETRQGLAPRYATAGATLPHSFVPIARNGAAMPMRMATRQNFAGAAGLGTTGDADYAQDFGLNGASLAAPPESPRPGGGTAQETSAATLAGMDVAAPGSMSPAEFRRALEACTFQLCRLPPIGVARFNTGLSPLFAGMNIPV